MNQETKICQNCKNQFTIEPDDFTFYKKIQVPPPTFCSECRLQRRLSWRNERSLYQAVCQSCNQSMISIYSSEKPFSVYCSKCWWSDVWDPLKYGRAYNFSRPFFEQFHDLMLVVPRVNLGHKDAVDSPFTNYIIHVKNSYLVFGGHDVEDSCCVSLRSFFLKNCFDVTQTRNSEFCYESTDCNKCYQVFLSQYCEACSESAFLYDCRNCSNCFACVGLRNKSYHIFNQPYTKEEYRRKLKELDIGSHQKLKDIERQHESLRLSFPRKYAMIFHSEHVTGDDIVNAKNCNYCFAATQEIEDCAYLWSVDRAKNTYDVNFSYVLELCYEGMSTVEGRMMLLSNASWANSDITYADNCHDCSNIFGCAGLRNKEYCIFNKQYSKAEYESLVPKIIDHMNKMPYADKGGRIYKYGEFFSSELSPFNYNETVAQEYFPLTKEQAVEQGYAWKDPEKRDYEVTVKSDSLPDHIKDVKDNILQQVIGCKHAGMCNEQCATAFKIIPDELQFYRKMNLPLPRLCPNCRHYQRVNQKNPLKTWHRKCQCAGAHSDNKVYKNTIEHFHKDNHCPNEFETTYAPDRPEVIYCEKCYQSEVV